MIDASAMKFKKCTVFTGKVRFSGTKHFGWEVNNVFDELPVAAAVPPYRKGR